MEQSTWTKLDWVFELPLQYLAALEMPPNAKYILCRLPAFDLLFTLQPAV